jgi:hypothetical protein
MEMLTAETIYQLMIGVVIPVFVSNIKKVSWSSQYKFLLAFGFSILASCIVPIAKLLSSGSFDFFELLAALSVIFTTSQVVYQGIFKMLHVEDSLNPQSALLSLVKEQVSAYLETISPETTKDLLNPESPSSLSIDIRQFDDPEFEEDPVE